MQVRAYVLIQTEVGRSADVAAAAAELEGVTASDQTTGPYDVIVLATAPDINELGRLVISRLQTIDGIQRTLTCPVVEV